MKRDIFSILVVFIVLALSGFFPSTSRAAVPAPMDSYCQIPPIVSQAIQPNIMLAMDVSGSMSWCGYYAGANANYPCDPNCATGPGGNCGYNASKVYEGYFTPDKYYNLDANGVYQETVATGNPCIITCTANQCVRSSSRCANAGLYGSGPGAFGCGTGHGRNTYGCCTDVSISGDCNVQSGNFLNYVHMTRIDLLRWAMTGGSPATCPSSYTCTSGTCDPTSCDPEVWSQSGNSSTGKVGTVCNDALPINDTGTITGGCILEADDGTQLKVPWDRVYAGLAFIFEGLSILPRMGELAFGGSQVVDGIFVGDFTSANSTNVLFPYMNLISHLNTIKPNSSTPTGPAMWDMLNYYAQKDPLYGGLPAQSGSGDHWKNPMYICQQGGTNCLFVPCAGNYVILMSDGQWNTNGRGNVDCSIGNLGADPCTSASSDPVVAAYCMHKGFTNVKSGDPLVNTKVAGVYSISLFAVAGASGDQALRNVAMYGSFDYNATTKPWPDNLNGFPGTSCYPTDCAGLQGRGSSCTALPPSSTDWDKNNDGLPDTYYNATDALEIKNTILSAVLDILRRTSSGTAVSILASGEGSGANLLQAFFYPKKDFGNAEISWIGEMQNLWYYLDPKLALSTIREDTDMNKELDLLQDNVVHFRFDSLLNKTVADLYKDNTGDGSSLTLLRTVELEKAKNLWEAGSLLWARDPATTPRRFYTTTDGASLLSFSTANAGTLQSYLQAGTLNEARNIINYVGGFDVQYCASSGAVCTSNADCPGDTCASYRSRTASIDTNGNNVIDAGETHIWKLGDIISSTPRLQSWIRLNTYDSSAPTGYSDSSYNKFVNSSGYKGRGMVYVGANDGMLHAFKLGKLVMEQLDTKKARLDNPDPSVPLGQEMWAFIPKNSLPYLRYLGDPDYCHLYYVDATPYLFDASIGVPGSVDLSNNSRPSDGSTWRTILIGGMGQGGACRNASAACNSTTNGLPDCVKTPMNDVGYSSYFALDVTDPANPTLLWELSDSRVGFSTSGPLIVRTGGKDKNGKWFAVFASGPTGPIDSGSHQFLGRSDQPLSILVVDVKSGSVVRTMSAELGLSNAFGSSIMNTPIDTDRWKPSRTGNYQDDVFYVGYTQQSGTSWAGGVVRVITKESTNPDDWVPSILINGIGPVTASISHLQDTGNHKLWLYFGTGRYFYKAGTTIDDADAVRAIYGVKEPCYLGSDQFDSSCTAAPLSGLTLADTPPATEPPVGWYITLDGPGTSFKAERLITNPLAAFTGAVFFTTFAPTADVCGFSGNSYLWAVNYSTGGVAPSSALRGMALIQVSTGEIKEVALSSAFTERGNRRSNMGPGAPPKGSGMSAVITPRPIRKILHMRER
ncbi:MAG: PilC/PilY family type IV pilus protein [Nitrospirae bacterium]|nr:PilC/PilY family type IV pilus protein [Nitrospirota bacterium]